MGENSKIEWCDNTFNGWTATLARVGKRAACAKLDGREYKEFPSV